MKAFSVAGWAVLAVLVVLGLSWGATSNDFFLYKFFAPKQEAVRREVFEQSKAYNQGMQQELDAMHVEYVKATPEQQSALASVILHRMADYDESKLSPDLRAFVEQLRNRRITP